MPRPTFFALPPPMEKRMPLRSLFAFVALSLPASLAAAQAARPHVPTVDELLEVRTASGPQISPDGRRVAYLVSQADWSTDAFVTQAFFVSSDGGDPRQLTRGEKPATQLRWSPDGQWLAFLSPRAGDKPQIFVIRPDGGEAVQLTRAENGVQAYQWSRDGRAIAFTSVES